MSGQADHTTPTWQARFGSISVTPQQPGPLAGYADRTADSTGELDPLEVNLLILQPAVGPPIGWLSIDAIAITEHLRRTLTDAVTARVGEVKTLLCLASHTHAAPAGWVGTIHPVLPAATDPALLAELAARIREMPISTAEVTLTIADGEVSGVGSNRHRPDGPYDGSTRALIARDRDHRPVAVLYDYACHPTVLGADNAAVSADWVGATRQSMRDRYNPALVVVYGQGAAGDASPRFHRTGQTAAELQRLGGRVADALTTAIETAVPISGNDVQVWQYTITAPTRPLTAAGSATPAVEDDHGQQFGSDRLARSRAEGRSAFDALTATNLPATLTLPVTIVLLGEVGWVHLPLELAGSYGLSLRSGRPDLRVIGYTDSYFSYLADPPAHTAGQYEALSSYFDAATSDRLISDCLALLPAPREA